MGGQVAAIQSAGLSTTGPSGFHGMVHRHHRAIWFAAPVQKGSAGARRRGEQWDHPEAKDNHAGNEFGEIPHTLPVMILKFRRLRM